MWIWKGKVLLLHNKSKLNSSQLATDKHHLLCWRKSKYISSVKFLWKISEPKNWSPITPALTILNRYWNDTFGFTVIQKYILRELKMPSLVKLTSSVHSILSFYGIAWYHYVKPTAELSSSFICQLSNAWFKVAIFFQNYGNFQLRHTSFTCKLNCDSLIIFFQSIKDPIS